MEYIEKKEMLLKYIEMYEIDKDIEISEDMIKNVMSYMDYILEKNKYINLTAIKDEEMFIKKHLIDSLYIVKYFKNNLSKWKIYGIINKEKY